MELNEQSVAAYTTLMKDPSTHGLPFRKLSDCFQECDTATPKHILFKDYQNEVPQCPKVIFYIVMDSEYPKLIAKAPTGELGYKLKFIERENNS